MTKSIILILMCCAGSLCGQVPIPGSEDIPEIMEQSALVCRGEVVEVEVGKRVESTGEATALVRVERSYKGTVASGSIKVLFKSLPDPLATSLTLSVGEHLLLFLNPSGDNYVFADPFFGKLVFPRQTTAQNNEDGSTPQGKLERDLEAVLISGHRQDVVLASLMLGNLRKVRSTDPLKRLLPTSDPQIDAAINIALIKLGDYSKLSNAAEVFRRKNADVQTENLRGQLARAIANLHDPSIVSALEAFSGSESGMLRHSAVRALRTIASPVSVPYLIDRLDDTDSDIRYLSVMALAAIVHKVGDWAPSRELFDQQESTSLNLWREWWQHEGQRDYPRDSLGDK